MRGGSEDYKEVAANCDVTEAIQVNGRAVAIAQ